MIKNLCLKCPDTLRGDCCYVNAKIGGFNVILEHVPCPMLDTVTGYCKEYETRDKYPWCLEGEGMFNKGTLPEGCLYLLEDPSREGNPKQRLEVLLKGRSKKFKRLMMEKYEAYESVTFDDLKGYLEVRS